MPHQHEKGLWNAGHSLRTTFERLDRHILKFTKSPCKNDNSSGRLGRHMVKMVTPPEN